MVENLFGITELELDGSSVLLSGDNGTGKTSVLDAIKYALTNGSERDKIIKQGATEGEIVIETDTGLSITRKKREQQADYKSVRVGRTEQGAPENYLRSLFTPLQIDPVAFTEMTPAEQNRAILELVVFEWDTAWIKAQFGEIPDWPDYSQHILVVLEAIQSENGGYYQRRQDVNREARNQRAFIEKIANSLPAAYDADRWEKYDLGAKFQELEQKRAANKKIEDARAVKESFESRRRGLVAQYETEVARICEAIQNDRETLINDIARLEAELIAAKEKLSGLDERREDKVKVVKADFRGRMDTLMAQLEAVGPDADKEPENIDELSREVYEAERMKRFLNEHARMLTMQAEESKLTQESQALTDKIELARSLPGTILETAKIPVKGLTVENCIPLINGLPINNLSEGEQLDLCVDVTLANPKGLQIILIDGVEKLSTHNRERLFNKCREKGIQFIATATDDSAVMEVHHL
jgi:predicted ATP-dependent endonuclease of OLD family